MKDVGDTASAGTASAAVNPCHEQESMTGDKIVLKEFILNLESMKEVWNSGHVNYKNTILKNEALKILLTIYKRIKSDATIDDIKKKINSLRSNYRKELKKIVDSKRSGAGSGDVYQPKSWSWVFHLLHFLSKTEQPVAPSAPVSSVGSQEVKQSERQEGDTAEQSSGAFSSLNVPTPPNPKKKKGPIAKQNELLDKACSLLSQNVDQASQNTPSINPTALYWSSKLDKLDPIQRYHAERFINDILLEAELGNLTRNSVHISVRDDITTPTPAHLPYAYNPPTPSQISNSLISAPTPSPPSVNVVTSQGNTTMGPIYIVNSSTSTNSSASGTTGFTSQLLMQKSVKPVMLQRQEEQMNYQQFHGNNVNNTLQPFQRPQEHISVQQLHANNNISENAFHQADYDDARDGRQPSNQDATLSALFSSFTDI